MNNTAKFLTAWVFLSCGVTAIGELPEKNDRRYGARDVRLVEDLYRLIEMDVATWKSWAVVRLHPDADSGGLPIDNAIDLTPKFTGRWCAVRISPAVEGAMPAGRYSFPAHRLEKLGQHNWTHDIYNPWISHDRKVGGEADVILHPVSKAGDVGYSVNFSYLISDKYLQDVLDVLEPVARAGADVEQEKSADQPGSDNLIRKINLWRRVVNGEVGDDEIKKLTQSMVGRDSHELAVSVLYALRSDNMTDATKATVLGAVWQKVDRSKRHWVSLAVCAASAVDSDLAHAICRDGSARQILKKPSDALTDEVRDWMARMWKDAVDQ